MEKERERRREGVRGRERRERGKERIMARVVVTRRMKAILAVIPQKQI